MGAEHGGSVPPLTDDVRSALLARRVVMVSGELDLAKASELSATLMTLDALGDDHVELRISSSTGSFESGLVLVDVIDVLGVPVHTVGLGVVGGGLVAVLAAGAHRALARHARLHLREPDMAVEGRAADIERAVAEQAHRRDVVFGHLARCTGRPVGEVAAEWEAGRHLSAEDAVTLGYADHLLA